MELFTRRPFLFSCFLFMVFSLLSYVYGLSIVFLILLSSLALISIVFAIFIKKYRSKFLLCLTCIIFAISGVLNILIRVDLKQQKSEEIIGEGITEAVVLSEISKTDYYNEYSIRIKYADGENVNIKSILLTYFDCDLEIGDRIYAYAKIDSIESDAYKNKNKDPDTYLITIVNDSSDMLIFPDSASYPAFSREWFEDKVILADRKIDEFKTYIGERLITLTNKEAGGLAFGFLTGSKENISTDTIRDFRRSGISHLLAVSGLHVSILLGSIELLLRKLYVDKKVRIIIISLSSVFLLAITGFSESAMRAVFMLMYVYLAFLFSEDNDSPTSLFLAGVLIVLISPHSLSDIGFWMSFLATLGIVTYYSFYQQSINEISQKRVKKHCWLKIPRSILYTVLITLTANLFIAFISYLYFGEISVIAALSNLLISPIAYIFLITIPLLLLFGNIPFIGNTIGFIIIFLSKIIFFLASKLSSIAFASISLEYYFIPYILWSVTGITALFLVIRLKHKWLTILPVIGGIIAFSVCLIIFNNTLGKPTLHCYGKEDKALTVTEESRASVYIDSNAYYNDYKNICDNAREYGATEIENLVIGDLSEINIPSLQYFLNNSIVRNIYFPKPENKIEAKNAVDIASICNQNAIRANIIKEGNKIPFSNSVDITLNHYSGEKNVYNEVTFISDIEDFHYKKGSIFTKDYSKVYKIDKDIKIKLYSPESE